MKYLRYFFLNLVRNIEDSSRLIIKLKITPHRLIQALNNTIFLCLKTKETQDIVKKLMLFLIFY